MNKKEEALLTMKRINEIIKDKTNTVFINKIKDNSLYAVNTYKNQLSLF